MPSKFFETLLSGLPIIGNIGSLLLQRQWAKKDLERQNQYNSPQNQLRLLKQAGLPAASFFAGGVGQQSEQPRSVTQGDLGTSETFGKFALNRIQKNELSLLDEQVKQARIETQLKSGELMWLMHGLGRGNQGQLLELNKMKQIADLKGISLANAIAEINKEVKGKFDFDIASETLKGKTLGNIREMVGIDTDVINQEIVKKYGQRREEAEVIGQELKNSMMSLEYQIKKATKESDIERILNENEKVRNELIRLEQIVADEKVFNQAKRELVLSLLNESGNANIAKIFDKFISALLIKFVK